MIERRLPCPLLCAIRSICRYISIIATLSYRWIIREIFSIGIKNKQITIKIKYQRWIFVKNERTIFFQCVFTTRSEESLSFWNRSRFEIDEDDKSGWWSMRESRRFSINRNAIADILFQGLNDLHFPSLSLSRLDRRDYIWRNETIIGPRIRRVDRSSIGLYIYMYREKTKKKKKKRHTARARRRDFPGIIERFVPQLRINYGEMMDGTKSRWLLPIYPPVIRSRLVWRRLHRRGAEMSLRNLVERSQPTRSSSPNYGLLPSHRGAPS